LQKIIVDALQANVKGEESIAGTEKVKRFQLAVKVYSGDEVELSAEDIALIKDLIGKLYGPLVVGRSYELLES
jgi:hypothetical protein